MIAEFGYVILNNLSGKQGGTYQPKLAYKIESNTIIVWAVSSIVSAKASCINLLHGNALFPMVFEEPPEDAIQPTW